jgi:hypothetical protein
MPAPVAYPSVAQFDGVAPEGPTTPGTPVAMTNTIPLESDFKWEDKYVYIADKGKRGVMGDTSFNRIQGVKYCDVSSMGGAVFMDTFPFLLANILGDVVTTGTAAPYSTVCALLNPTSGAPTAQPPTLTWTHYDGVTTTTGARQIPYFCLSQLVISWDNATGLLMWTGKGQGWASQAAGTRPSPAPSSQTPKAAWTGQLALAGTVGGGQNVTNLESFKLTIDRELENEFMGNGSQNSLMVARGGLSSTFEATWLAQDLTAYNELTANTQPQMQAIFTAGTGAALVALQLDMQQSAFTKCAPNYGKKMVRWDSSGEFEFNSTNVGASGGQGPLVATAKNAVTSGTYV